MNQTNLTQRLRDLLGHAHGAADPGDGRRHLLDDAHHGVLDTWACGHTLFAFDYDGTLAPIVDEPAAARMPDDTWVGLRALADEGCVAIISGRDRAGLLKRVPQSVLYVIGNHGNEGLPGHTSCRPTDEQVCESWEHQLRADNLWLQLPRGVVIENKGATLALHYRRSPNPLEARDALLERVQAIVPAPRVIHGVLVINLLPPAAHTKREALSALMAHSACDRAVFVGDDASDELVFADAPPHWLTISVGPDNHSQARYYVRDPKEVGDLLFAILRRRHKVVGSGH